MLITVGMPVFNDIAFIRQSLDSILQQSFTNFELIISDDQSTDGSADICKAYAEKDSRIRYIRQSRNIGISANMKFLLNEAKGKYFMWAANDDLWENDFIQLLIEGLESNQNCVAAFVPYVCIDEQENEIKSLKVRAIDYSGPSSYHRIVKLTKYYDDAFGYGVFVREKILDVRFPTWVWPNARCAYNNIYPSLFYYLTKGNFLLVGSKPRWYNRIKNQPHHKVPYRGRLIPCYLAFVVRKMNVAAESIASVRKGGGSFRLIMKISPYLFKRFAEDCWLELRAQIRNYKTGIIKLV
jgi:glycosyltransferase involved in cell wall biosynthesis